MSHTHLAGPSSPNFQLVLNDALKAYEKQTKHDLLTHPLAAQLQDCQSPGSILIVLQQQVQQLNQSAIDDRLAKWLDPTVNVLYAFSGTLGEAVGLGFSPAKVIFAGVGVLLAAACSSQETLIDLFERIENFFRRLEIYAEVPPTPEMMDMMVKIMVEVLSILGIATKEIKQGRTKKYLRRLTGRTDMEDALKRLDRLTHEETRMAVAQNLKATHVVDDRVMGVVDKVLDVGRAVNGIDASMANIDEAVQGVNDTVAVVVDDGRETRAVIQQAANDVDQIKRTQLLQDLRRWLSPPDPSTNHNIACGTRHQGTAEWFFQSSIFTEWKSTGSFLWVHGKPGSGKSVLCSTIIKDIIRLRDSGLASMAYFYCDFRDESKQHRRDLLPSLVVQLSARLDSYCDILSRLYLTHDSGAQKPSEQNLMKCLEEMVALPDHPPVYIIIDALDECPDSSGMPSPREQVLGLLEELADLSLPNIHVCVTSRPEVDILNALEPLTSRQVSLHDQSGQKKDIVAYVTSVVRSDPKMRRWRDEDRKLVIDTLSERADGMFRWVYCQLEALRHCLPPSLRQILEELPETLDETYERVLKEINKAKREHAHRLLQCLTVAVRPLRIAELAEVLAVDFGTASNLATSTLNPDWRWEDQEQAVLSTCSSLIAVVDEYGDQVIQFSHFSVKEFLTSTRLAGASVDVSRFHIRLEPAHTILAKACLGTLLRLDDQVDKYKVKDRFPLARYAADHWTNHAQFEGVSSQLREGMKILFDPDQPYFSAWIRMHDMDVEPDYVSAFWSLTLSSGDKAAATPLYYVALIGLHDVASHLIDNYPQQVNARGGYYVSPLGAALGMGHFEMAQLLYQHGADLDVLSYGKWTLLHAMSLKGQVEIAQWLLARGVDPNVRNCVGATPLHLAASNGRLEVARVLLQQNAYSNTLDNHGRIPLHQASERGYLDVSRLLLGHGADVNACDKDGSTPLHLASKEGMLEVARLLIEHDAGVGAEDNKRRTPFRVAKGREMKTLLTNYGSK